jgi:hypothetical protein
MLEEVSDVISFFVFFKYPVFYFTSTKVQILTQMLEEVSDVTSFCFSETQCTCFTSTKVQILTRGGSATYVTTSLAFWFFISTQFLALPVQTYKY